MVSLVLMDGELADGKKADEVLREASCCLSAAVAVPAASKSRSA